VISVSLGLEPLVRIAKLLYVQTSAVYSLTCSMGRVQQGPEQSPILSSPFPLLGKIFLSFSSLLISSVLDSFVCPPTHLYLVQYLQMKREVVNGLAL
jgi:hypothetical protein